MTKKKATDSDEPRFEVKKRQPKEKPNFFQNIRSFEHPLAEILNFPPENSNIENPGTQNNSQDAPKDDIAGHSKLSAPDTQSIKSLDTQKSINLDSQINTSPDTQNLKNTGTQKLENTDTQKGYSLDTQSFPILTPEIADSGQPDKTNIGAQAPKLRADAPRKPKQSSAQAPVGDKVVHSKNEDWRKYDKARTTIRVNLHIDKDIDKKVRKYCFIDAEPKVELREFYERAALQFLDFLDTQNIGSLGAETPLDDGRLKMMYKTKPFIIYLYLRYNTVFNELSGIGKKWTARWSSRDDESAKRFNELPAAIIELGILQTQIQKGFGSSRIQTFKYYIDEIENVLGSGTSDQMLETILQYHRQIWKKQTGREVDLGFLEND